jgi:hypothetical protein
MRTLYIPLLEEGAEEQEEDEFEEMLDELPLLDLERYGLPFDMMLL